MTSSDQVRPQGWYHDLCSTFGHRYWDGRQWLQYSEGSLLPCA